MLEQSDPCNSIPGTSQRQLQPGSDQMCYLRKIFWTYDIIIRLQMQQWLSQTPLLARGPSGQPHAWLRRGLRPIGHSHRRGYLRPTHLRRTASLCGHLPSGEPRFYIVHPQRDRQRPCLRGRHPARFCWQSPDRKYSSSTWRHSRTSGRKILATKSGAEHHPDLADWNTD